MAVLRDLLVQGPARFLHDIWGSTFHGDVDGTSSYATNLTAAPVLAASGNNITVTAGGKTSNAFTIPFATNATSAGSAGTATKAGVSTIWMYPENNNEINFGGTNTGTRLYFGYRAKDSRAIPTEFVFGGSTGSAALTASKFVKAGGTSAQFLKADGTVDSTSYAALASPAFTGTPTAPTANAGTNTTQIATTAFVKTEINNVLAASDAMVYKGTLGTGGTITSLPATHSVGDTYKVITAGTWAGAKCEIGDMVICITNGTAAADAHWTVVQSNLDGAVTGPTSSVTNRVAIFDGTTGKVIKDSGFTISASVPSGAKFTDTTYSVLAAASGGTSASLVTTGEKYTWDNKVDKSAGVTAVSYDTTNKKITRTINGTAADVVTAATIVKDGGAADKKATYGIYGELVNGIADSNYIARGDLGCVGFDNTYATISIYEAASGSNYPSSPTKTYTKSSATVGTYIEKGLTTTLHTAASGSKVKVVVSVSVNYLKAVGLYFGQGGTTINYNTIIGTGTTPSYSSNVSTYGSWHIVSCMGDIPQQVTIELNTGNANCAVVISGVRCYVTNPTNLRFIGVANKADELTSNPSLQTSGATQVTVTAGGKTSSAYTIPYATSASTAGYAGSASSAVNATSASTASYATSASNAVNATSASTASNLTAKPTLATGSTDANKIKVTAGGKTSDEFTVPYAVDATKLYATHIPSGSDMNTYTSIGVYGNTSTSDCISFVNAPTSRSNGEMRLEVIGCENSTYYLFQRYWTKAGVNWELYTRAKSGNSWGSWVKNIDSGNYTTYTVKKDGTGASGSWNITASNATKLNGQSASYYASSSHNHDSDYLKLVSGSTPVSFNTNNLPAFSGAPSYLVGIEAFASGGTLKWQNASECTVGSATRATNLAGGAANKIPYQTAAGTTSFIAAGTSGQVLKAGTNGVPTWGTDNDTKNTAGTTNSASVKLFIVGAKEQSANPQTFTNVNTYINTDNNLYSNGFVAATSVRAKGKDMYLGTASADQFHMQYDSTTRCVKFIFD